VGDVCAAASWSSPHTFVRFYSLGVTGPSVAHSVLSARSELHQGAGSDPGLTAALRGVNICPRLYVLYRVNRLKGNVMSCI